MGEPMPGGDDDDDDVVMAVTDLAPNPKCPYCSLELMVLKNPVEDLKGIVYCALCVDTLFKQAKGKTSIKCPQAGALDNTRGRQAQSQSSSALEREPPHARAGSSAVPYARGVPRRRRVLWCSADTESSPAPHGAGTAHEIRKSEFKPAKLVLRAQRRAAKNGTAGGAGAGGSGAASKQKQAQVVIDEDEDE